MNKHTRTTHTCRRLQALVVALRTLSVVLPLALLPCSCAHDEDSCIPAATATDTYLSLNVQTSAPNKIRSRASEADLNPANPTTESSIHSIYVWAFATDDTRSEALPIGYRGETLDTPVDGESNTKTVSMKIPRQSDGKTIEKIDLYILANAESLPGIFDGVTSYKTLTRGQLKNLAINQQFGISTDGKAQCTEVPDKGLPISRVLTAINTNDHVAETEAAATGKAINISLVRAVSKLHFFFARKSNAATGEAEITKIILDSDVLPTASPLFPTATTESKMEDEGLTGEYPSSTTYVATKLTLPGVETAKIKEVEDPTTLIRQNEETASTYMNRLYAATIECDRCYLRESNKTLSGIIYYKLNASAQEKSVTFSIPAESMPASRNSELVVYGYFLNGGTTELNLEYYVAEWNTKSTTDITFN